MKLLLKISVGISGNQLHPLSQSHDYFISNAQYSIKSLTHHMCYHSLTIQASFRRTHAEHYLMKLNPISRTNRTKVCPDTTMRFILNIHKGYRCRFLIRYWSTSKASRKNINNPFSCISVGGIAQLVSVCCLFLIYYTSEWLRFISESAHGKICINKVTVHGGAYGHPIPNVLRWCR